MCSVASNSASFRLVKEAAGFRITPVSAADIALVDAFLVTVDHPGLVPATQRVDAVLHLMFLAKGHGFAIAPTGRFTNPVLVLTHASEPCESIWASLSGDYAAKWSVSDFYDEHYTILADALASGQPFDTGEFAARKEIEYGRVSRTDTNGAVYLMVRCEYDDPVELADTAFWKAAGHTRFGDGEEALLHYGVSPDDIEDELDNLVQASEMSGKTKATCTDVIEAGTTDLEAVIERLDALAEQCYATLESDSAVMEAAAVDRLDQLKKRREKSGEKDD